MHDKGLVSIYVSKDGRISVYVSKDRFVSVSDFDFQFVEFVKVVIYAGGLGVGVGGLGFTLNYMVV